MNQQNMSKAPSSSASELPIKRKRGRPRKDESMPRNDKRQPQTTMSPSQPQPIPAMTTIQPPPPTLTMPPTGDSHNMVGQVVAGVIDGVFDAGYLISVRVGPNNTLLRGLVFQQGQFCPITPANDVAPHLKMCRRENYQIPNSNQTQLCTKQPPQLSMPVTMGNYQNTPMITGGSSNSGLPPENLRLVEQDELMQVFEVSKMVQVQVQEPQKNDDCGHGLKNDQLQLQVSESDLMTESTLPRNEVMKHGGGVHGGGAPLVQEDMNNDQSVNVMEEGDRQNGEGENNTEPVNHVETGMEEAPAFEKDILQQESENQGEVSKIDVNQDPNQSIATDLFQSN